MNLPPGKDRRHLPRHIRDGEHELLGDEAGEVPSGPARPASTRFWIVAVVAVAAALGLYRLLSG
jgi:hypothetical protein